MMMESISEERQSSAAPTDAGVGEVTRVGGDRDYILAKVRGQLFTAEPSVIRLGHFVMLEQIGSGGMGMVFAAYDERLDRKIAIKFLREDELPTEEHRLRFLREAQALARLSHPNVVTVHAVEQHEERMYLAMEFVRGQSLATWLRPRPPWREVLDAFVQAGRGLAAAHEAGLLHRDFKPHNVMRDEDGLVKVLDFGLVRAIGTESTELNDVAESSGPTSTNTIISSSTLTVPGTVMGTPKYMSPEQHLGDELDARSDQYSFCMALWEGLAAERPFLPRDYDALVRAKLAGPPSWPDSDSDSEPVPRRIVDALRRGLAAEPEDRWPSMEALLGALQVEPRGHRRRSWPSLVVAGLVGLGAGALGLQASSDAGPEPCTGAEEQLAGIWDPTRRAEVEAAILGIDKPYATNVSDRSVRELDDYAAGWVTMHTDACEATSVRREQSSEVLDLRMGCLRRAAGQMRATVDALASADAEVVQRAHELMGGLTPLSRCADVEALKSGVEPPPPEEADAVAAGREALARAWSSGLAGRYQAASVAIDDAERLLADVEYEPVRTEVALARGSVSKSIGEFEASEAALEDALERAVQHGQRRELRAAARMLIRVVGVRQGRVDEGLRYRSLAAGLSNDHPLEDARLRNTVALALHARGDYEEAEAEIRTALASVEGEPATTEQQMLVSGLRGSLGMILIAQGRGELAVAESRAAMDLNAQALGPNHPAVARMRGNLGAMLVDRGSLEDAEQELRAALSGLEESLGREHADVATTRMHLANVLTSRGQYQESEAELRATIPMLGKALGSEHPFVGVARVNLASALSGQDEVEDAEAELRQALAVFESSVGPEHLYVVSARVNLANMLLQQERSVEAEAEYRRVLLAMEQSNQLDHPTVAVARGNLAETLRRSGRFDEARTLSELAWVRNQRDGVPWDYRAENAFSLARILWSIEGPHRDRERARRLAEDALRTRRDALSEPDDGIDRIERWLDENRLP